MSATNLNAEAFRAALSQADKPVLVDFWAPWCTYCRRIGPAYDKIAQQYGDSLIVGKVNIDDEPALSQQEQIEVIPTLVLYQNGQAVASIVAPESKAMIDQFLEESFNRCKIQKNPPFSIWSFSAAGRQGSPLPCMPHGQDCPRWCWNSCLPAGRWR